jgi:hypothetical protein
MCMLSRIQWVGIITLLTCLSSKCRPALCQPLCSAFDPTVRTSIISTFYATILPANVSTNGPTQLPTILPAVRGTFRTAVKRTVESAVDPALYDAIRPALAAADRFAVGPAFSATEHRPLFSAYLRSFFSAECPTFNGRK